MGKRCKFVICIMIFAVCIGAPWFPVQAEAGDTDSIHKCYVNDEGKETAFPILVEDGVPMIAVRDVGVVKEVNVEWSDNTALLTSSGQSAKIFLNQDLFQVDHKTYRAQKPAGLVGERLYIPVDMAAQCASASYRWDKQLNTLFFYTYPEYTAGLEQTSQENTSMDGADIFTEVLPSMLYIEVYQKENSLKDRGSGVVISKDGYAATALHVVEGAVKIAVWYQGEKLEDIQVVKIDKENDMAILRLPPSIQYKALTLESAGRAYGQKLYAAGYSSKTEPLITEGIVVSPRYTVMKREGILTNAVFVPGMSGGPVVDQYGKVIGIISGSLVTLQNLNLVSPGSEIAELLIEGEEK